MKNLFKVFGIIALIAVIGFSFTACDLGTGSGGDDEGFKPVKVTVTLQNDLTGDDTDNILGVQVARGHGIEYLICGPTSNDYDETLQVAAGGEPITFSFTATEGDTMSFYISLKLENGDHLHEAYAITRQEIEEHSGGELKLTLSLGDNFGVGLRKVE